MSFVNRNPIEFSLEEVDKGLVELEHVLGEMPSFKSVLQGVVLKELQQLSPEIYISRTYITALREGIANPQPTGLVMDVFMKCLELGRAPVYDATQYGVYDWPDSTDELDRVHGLDVVALGSLIGEVLGSLEQKYPPLLEQHWSASSGKDAERPELVSRRRRLQEVHAALFWRELRATVQMQGGMAEVEESYAGFIKGKSPTPAYGLSLQLESGRFATLAGCFVTYLTGRSVTELVPGDDEWVVLYTPVSGLETFRTSALMQRTLEQRLDNADSRAQLLKGVFLEETDQIKGAAVIRYLNIQGELFQTLTTQLLEKQRRDVAYHFRQLKKPGADLQAIVRLIESTHRQQTMFDAAKGRMANLLVLMNNNARPQWLKAASATNQEVFASLEKELLRGQVALHEAMGGVSSFQDYVRGVVETHVCAGDTQHVDPDSVWVTVQHSLRMGARRIEHVERKTLTQLFMYGVHDAAAPYTIKLEAFHNNPRLTPPNIELAIRQFDLRVQYANERNDRFGQARVREAMREVLGQQIAVSNFAATLQKNISPQAQNIVQRYLFGDPAFEAFGVAFRRYYRPFKDMIAFRAKGPASDRLMHVLYAPGAPTGQQWFEFSDLTALKRQFIAWGFEPRDREFLTGQAFSKDREAFVRNELSYTEPAPLFQPWWWDDVTLVQWTQGDDGGPLMGAIRQIIEWEVAEEQVATPVWYRNAAAQDRELLTRLSTELKAIHQVSKDELPGESLAAFSRNLVMKELNDYLRRSGPHPEIDPDRVTVKLKGQDWMTLTNLFLQWQVWSREFVGVNLPSEASDPYTSNLLERRKLLQTAIFESLDNTSLGRLNSPTIDALIDLRPGEKYAANLKSNFLAAPATELKAKLYCKSVQNQMLRAAVTQKMQGSLSANQFNWLKGLIDALDHDRPGGPNSYQLNPVDGVNTLSLEGQRLEGGYTFARTSGGWQECLLYIPNAPDGLMFRPLEKLTEGLRNYTVGEHVIGLARLADRTQVTRFVELCRRTSGPALQTPRLQHNLAVKNFGSEYFSMVHRLIDDIDHQTISWGEYFWGKVLFAAELVVDVISLFVPPVGLVASIVRITRSIVQGIVAYSLGDDDAGRNHLASAWSSSILLYVGVIAGVGGSVSAVGALSRVKDIAEIVSTATGVPVGVGFITTAVSPHVIAGSKTHIVG
ncbi:hypothetical protein N8H71_16020 [Pseudomonas koreensis]|uniref:dermonecrotic toxin domain-containing protein n=1 Tax=Pseudomonas koreensis TaxID=198620 RepID=UPI0021CA3316|nr:DUF6543 domain-containing protein [Pseudomonas koreensis]MCU0073099.1 hypothetical protein [Pseudomonas koreensis]